MEINKQSSTFLNGVWAGGILWWAMLMLRLWDVLRRTRHGSWMSNERRDIISWHQYRYPVWVNSHLGRLITEFSSSTVKPDPRIHTRKDPTWRGIWVSSWSSGCTNESLEDSHDEEHRDENSRCDESKGDSVNWVIELRFPRLFSPEIHRSSDRWPLMVEVRL